VARDANTWLSPWHAFASGTKRGLERDSLFHAADCMERGTAHEMTADFLQPLRQSEALSNFHVLRSEDRHEYRLFSGVDKFMLYARVAPGVKKIDIYSYDPQDPDSSLYDAANPAFTLTRSVLKDSREEWRLAQAHCDVCRGSPQTRAPCSCSPRRELLVARHGKIAVGDGLNHILDVDLPGTSTKACGQASMGSHVAREAARLVSKLPSWNKKVGSLVLNFIGRRVEASAKNFQLFCEDCTDETVVCQFGKIGPHKFALDFNGPLSIAEAFALSLATVTWT